MVRRHGKHKFSITNYQLPIIKSKRWFRQHGRKLTMAGVAVVVALAMVVGFQPPIPTKATSNSVTWTTQGDFESNTVTGQGTTNRTNVDTTSSPGDVKLGPSSWNYSTLDSTGDVGDDSSIAMDSNHKIHISYRDGPSNWNLKYATNVTGSWVYSTIDNSINDVGTESSIAIGSNNKVYISYYDNSVHELWYITNESGDWVKTKVDASNWLRHSNTSIALDSNNKAYIAYFNSETDAIKYATNVSGSWQYYDLESTGTSTTLSLALDSNNKAYISYYDRANTDLKYATNATGSWVYTTLDSTGDVGKDNSIAIDSNDKLHISYLDETDYNYDLKYATNSPSGSWTYTTVDSTGVGLATSLALDSNNKAHISHYKLATSLKYATNVTGSWVNSTLDSTGTVGDPSSITLGPYHKSNRDVTGYNTPNISYRDTTNLDLKYANISYPSLGTIGGTGSSVGLREDAGTGVKANWTSITHSIETLAEGQAVKYAIKTSDNGSSWSGLLGEDGNAIDWTSGTGNYLGQAYGDGSASTTISGVTPSRYLDIVVRLESSGDNTPTLNEVTLNYDTIDAPQDSDSEDNSYMIQKKSDGTTTISKGGYTNETSVRLQIENIQGLADSTTMYGQFQYKEDGGEWSANQDGNSVAEGETSYKDISGLSNETDYIWRARVVDAQGRVSGWTEYNSGSVAFSVDSTAPAASNFVVKGNVSGSTDYVNAITDYNMTKATCTLSDNVSTTLDVQFSEDGTTWGIYDGTAAGAGSNVTTGGDTWTAGTYLTLSGITSTPTATDINTTGNNGAWKLSGDGSKTIYVRTKDGAGNVSGQTFTSQADWENTDRSNIDTASNSGDAKLSSGGVGGGANLHLLWDGGSAPSGWTIVSDSGGDFYQKFPKGAATYGGTGGSDIHSITANYVSMTTGLTSGALDGTSASFIGPHSHPINSSGDSASSLPLYRNLKIIKYNGSIPSTIPSGAIALFDSTVPSGWTQYSLQDNYYIRGENTVTVGGSNTHNHNVDITLVGNASGTVHTRQSGGSSVASLTHTHGTSNGPSSSANNEPTYITAILGKADSDTSLPGNIVGMFDGIPTGGWTVISDGGGDFNDKFVKAATSYGTTGGSETHTHSNFTVTTGGVSGTTNNPLGSIYDIALTSHTHNVTFSSNSENHVPSYVNTVFALAPPPYIASGTIGGTGTGLRIGNPESSNYYKWTNLLWSASGLSSTYKIRIQVRPADTWGSGDTGYVNPSDGSASWYELTSGTSGTIPLSASFSNTKTLEIRVELVGDGNDTPILHDLTVESSGSDTITLDTAPPSQPSLNEALSQVGGSDISGGNGTTWYNYTAPYFTWNASSDSGSGLLASPYKAYYGTSSSGDPSGETPQSDLNHTGSGMSSSNSYYLRVIAGDNAGNWSTATTLYQYKFDNSAPDAVTNLAGTAVDTSTIRLTWSTPTDDVGVTGYSIERKEASEDDSEYGEVATLGAVNTHDDTGLEAGMTYNYRMKAKDAVPNWSGYSNVAEAHTEDTVPPSAPTLSSVTAQSGGFTIDLVFTGAYDAVGIVGYKIERSKDATNWTEIKDLSTTQTTNVTYQDNDTNNDTNSTQRLTDNQIYYYRVRAYDQNYIDSSGTSGTISTYSNTNSATTPDVTAPSVPSGLSATPVSSSAILVQLSASTDKSRDGVTDGKGVIGYKFYRATSSDGPWTSLAGTSTTTSFTDSGRDALTTYYYKVKAVDKAGSDTDIDHASNNVSDLSTETTSATTYTDAVPTTPINTSATATQGDPATDPNVGHQVEVTFTGAASWVLTGTPGYSLNHYEVYRYQGDTFPTPNPGGDGILTEAEFNSWLSSTSLVKVGSDISVTSQTQTTRNDVEYKYVDDNSYQVYDNNLTDNQTYKYGVFVFDNTPSSNVPSGPFVSGVSPVASSQTPDVTPPDSPSQIEILDIFASPDSQTARVIVTWAPIVQPADFKEYRLYRSTDGTTYTLLASTTDSYYVDGTVDDTSTYYYKITSADTTLNAGKNNESAGMISDPVTPGQRDITPPVLSSIQSAPSVSSATISWTTDEAANSVVEYSTNSDFSGLVGHGYYDANTTSHSVAITGLKPNTTYYYRARSEDTAGNVTRSSGGSFKTQTFSITSGPSVSASTNVATVYWRTNFPSTSLVEYRKSYGFSYLLAGSNEMTASHAVTLSNLSPGTVYYYKVRSEDANGNKAESSGILAFSTGSGSGGVFGAPSVSRLAEAAVTATTVKIVWQTSFATTTWVDYGLTSSYGISLGDNVFNNNHMVVITGLTPGVTYHYRTRGKDIQGNEYVSPDYTFTALAEPAISDIKVESVEAYEAIITFKTNIGTISSVDYGKTTDYGKREQSEDVITTHKHTLTGLEDDQEYHFQIEAKDEYGHMTKSSDQAFVTLKDTKGPKIKRVRTKVVRGRGEGEKSMVIITWQTDEPATSQVEYQVGTPRKSSYAKDTPEDDSFNISHTEMLTGLKPSTAYHFRIIAKDRRENKSSSADYTVLTSSKSQSILDMIIDALEESFSWVGNVRDFIVDKWQQLKASLSRVF